MSLKHWSFSLNPNSDIWLLLVFKKAFCSSWELSGCDSWIRGDVGRWSALTLLVSENRMQRHTHKHTHTNLQCPSLFYSSLNTNTDSPRNNSTRVKECCLSARGVILCHSVRVIFRLGWLVSVRRMWRAHEWQCKHTTYKSTHRWCNCVCLPLQFFIDIILSSWLQILT